MHGLVSSFKKDLLCCGPVTWRAEAARPFFNLNFIKKIEVDAGLLTTFKLQTQLGFHSHPGTRPFILLKIDT